MLFKEILFIWCEIMLWIFIFIENDQQFYNILEINIIRKIFDFNNVLLKIKIVLMNNSL